jgi:hypothetical protein
LPIVAQRWSGLTAVVARELAALRTAFAAHPARAFAAGAALTTGVLVAVAVATCAGGPAAPGVGRTAQPAAAPSPSRVPVPSPSLPPHVETDGCKGLLNASQASTAAGVKLVASGGDGEAAAAQYAAAVQTLGLTASVRVCPFASAAGDQVTVVALAFPDAGQAGKMYDTGRTAAGLKPVGGVGDAAATDRSKTMLVRKGKAVVTVFLVLAGNPDAEHVSALRAVAGAALTKA